MKVKVKVSGFVLQLRLNINTDSLKCDSFNSNSFLIWENSSFPFSLKNKTTFQVRLCLLLCDKIFFITVLRQIFETDKTDFVLLHKRMPRYPFNVKFMRSSIGLRPREFPLSTYSKWILKRVLYVLKEMSLPKICRLFSPKF